MKVLVTGAGGQLGYELQRSVPADIVLSLCDRQDLDLCDEAEVLSVLQQQAPDVLINAAAYTAVDKAESEPELAAAVNSEGAANLARACRAQGVRLIHISTDFVFDGLQSSPYSPEADPNPQGVYGKTKWEGERQVQAILGDAVIIRTAWLYSSHGQNFVKTMLRLMDERDALGVVADQVGTPTWAATLAEAIWALIRRPSLKGIYHWSDAGVASWYDFAVAIQEEALALDLLERAIAIRPLRSEDYPTPAKRPPYSVLDKTRSWQDFELEGRHWREGLREMLKRLKDA